MTFDVSKGSQVWHLLSSGEPSNFLSISLFWWAFKYAAYHCRRNLNSNFILVQPSFLPLPTPQLSCPRFSHPCLLYPSPDHQKNPHPLGLSVFHVRKLIGEATAPSMPWCCSLTWRRLQISLAAVTRDLMSPLSGMAQPALFVGLGSPLGFLQPRKVSHGHSAPLLGWGHPPGGGRHRQDLILHLLPHFSASVHMRENWPLFSIRALCTPPTYISFARGLHRRNLFVLHE